MDKTKVKCPKCGKHMDAKRSNADQCRKCRRKQQDRISYEIKKPKRKILSRIKAFDNAKIKGADKDIENDLLMTLEACIEDRDNPTKEEFRFLVDQIIYDFEREYLPKNVQDDYLKKLRETDFKFIFDKIRKSSS